MNKSSISILALSLIVIIAMFLRSIDISDNPPELHPDELINYLSAKSIIEEGKDLHGRLLPFFYDRVELRPPIYGYSAYLASIFFGNSTFAIRFPAMIYGLIAIIMLFPLVREMTNSHAAALFSSFCLAVIPWHIHYSRVGWEPASLLPFLLTSITLLVIGMNKKKSWLTLLGFAFFSLTIYTYQTAPLIAFLFLLAVICFNYRYFYTNKRLFLAGAMISGIIAVPYIWTALTEPQLYDRAKRISTFSTGFTAEATKVFLSNYLSHFGYKFLFQSGDPNLRHGAQTGVLYWWMLPFIIIGLSLLFKSLQKRWYIWFLTFWFIIFPIGSALTNDGVPHATRSLIGAPILCILSGIGLWQSVRFVYSRTNSKLIAISLVSAILTLSLIFLLKFSKSYYLDYPHISAAWWDYGHTKIFKKIKGIEKGHKRACLENLNYWNEIQIKKYYLEHSPLVVIKDMNQPDCKQNGSIIVVKARGGEYFRGKLVDTVYDLDDNPVYYIYTTNKR